MMLTKFKEEIKMFIHLILIVVSVKFVSLSWLKWVIVCILSFPVSMITARGFFYFMMRDTKKTQVDPNDLKKYKERLRQITSGYTFILGIVITIISILLFNFANIVAVPIVMTMLCWYTSWIRLYMEKAINEGFPHPIDERSLAMREVRKKISS